MSKLACRCGRVIRDQTDDLPHKAFIIPDSGSNELIDNAAQRILDTIKEGATEGWEIGDILFDVFVLASKDMYQCSECGRIHIQESVRSNKFQSFCPDESNWKINPLTVKSHEGS